jgi:hypothetical protein
MGTTEKANMSSETYLKGRRTGVEGTQGMSRKGNAEKTVLPKNDMHNSGSEGDLAECARSMYQRAVKNEGDSIGDRALTER